MNKIIKIIYLNLIFWLFIPLMFANSKKTIDKENSAFLIEDENEFTDERIYALSLYSESRQENLVIRKTGNQEIELFINFNNIYFISFEPSDYIVKMRFDKREAETEYLLNSWLISKDSEAIFLDNSKIPNFINELFSSEKFLINVSNNYGVNQTAKFNIKDLKKLWKKHKDKFQ